MYASRMYVNEKSEEGVNNIVYLSYLMHPVRHQKDRQVKRVFFRWNRKVGLCEDESLFD